MCALVGMPIEWYKDNILKVALIYMKYAKYEYTGRALYWMYLKNFAEFKWMVFMTHDKFWSRDQAYLRFHNKYLGRAVRTDTDFPEQNSTAKI